MALRYPVSAGTILLCDYNTGFREPEMVKRRPVIVMTPRLPYRDGLCSVIPLSQSGPKRDIQYQCKIALTTPLPDPFPYSIFWAKADMLATVSFQRLDLFRTARDQTGKRKYIHPKLGNADFLLV